MSLPMYSTGLALFCFFALINEKRKKNCVMINKMVWNERMSPFIHFYIIKGKI